MKGTQVAIGLFVVTLALVAAAGYALSEYESARAEWSALSGSLGEPGYDASRSDAAYARTETFLPWIGWGANAAAVALIALALAIGSMAPPSTKVVVTDGKLLGATLVDLLALVIAAAPGWLMIRADPGLTLIVTRLFPAVAVAWIAAAAASGRTLGARALRISLGTRPGADVGLRVLFAQPILLLAPLLVVAIAARRARGERPPVRWLAPHLALAGIQTGALA